MRRKAPKLLDLVNRTLAVLAADGAACSDAKTYTCTLVTPMYGGGVRAGEVDLQMPIRATAIRGQLRFWWRLLNARDEGGTLRTPKTLFEMERAIWGGLGDVTTLAKSRVKVAVVAGAPAAPIPVGTWVEGTRPDGTTFRRFVFNENMLGQASYALFPAAPDGNNASIGKVLPAGFHFTLKIGSANPRKPLSVEERKQVDAALRWWAAFGGVGARTRRGLGAIAVKDQLGKDLVQPSAEELHGCACALALDPHAESTAAAAWKVAVGKLKTFRQGVGVGRNPPSSWTGNRSPAGRSLWPEADTIKEVVGAHLVAGARTHAPIAGGPRGFPRAAFGMPIITQFKDAPSAHGSFDISKDPCKTELIPTYSDAENQVAEYHRMASPVIVRPLKRPGGWHAAALLLPHDHVRGMGVRLKNSGRPTNTPLAPGPRTGPRDYPKGTWQVPASSLASVTPLNLGGSADALLAFLKFFGGLPGAGARPLPPNGAPAGPRRIAGPLTLIRPTLKLQGNGAIIVSTPNGTWTLIGKDAEACVSALGPYAQGRLKQGKPFNRLDLSLDGASFVSLIEHSE